MAAIQQLFFNDRGYAVLVLATAVVGSWKARASLRCCTWALVASWASSRLLAGHVDVISLTEAYSLLHAGLLVLVGVLLLLDGALWLAAMAVFAALQFGCHLRVMLSPSLSADDLLRGYNLAITMLFTLQLACVWLARTPAGCWWPGRWRSPDLTVEDLGT